MLSTELNQLYRDAEDTEDSASTNTQDDWSESVVASEAESLPTGAVANNESKKPMSEAEKSRKHAINVQKRFTKNRKILARKIENPKTVQIN